MSRIGQYAYKNIIDMGEADSHDPNDVDDRGIYFSTDGQRRIEELHNVWHKKRRLEPSALKDVWAEWIPVPDQHAEEDAAQCPPEIVMDCVTVLGKRKEYASTVSYAFVSRIGFFGGIDLVYTYRWILCHNSDP
jgi:hypothetical protein